MNEHHFSEVKKYLEQYKWYVGSIFCLTVLCCYLAVRAFGHAEVGNKKKREVHTTSSVTNILHLTPEILKEYPITLSSVTEIEPSEEVLLPGRVQKDPTQTTLVTARAQGRVVKVRVKEADDVKAGQVLATIQSAEVAQFQSAHLRTLLRFEVSQRQMERSTELFEHQIVSAKEHELAVMEFQSVKTELEASRTQLKQLNLSKNDILRLEKEHTNTGELYIRSPISGVVIERKAALGQSVSAEDSLFTIGNTDEVWIVLDVYEKDIPLISEGISAEIRIPASSGQPKTMNGKVARIAQEIDATTRSAKVWLEVENREQELKFGQAISARIQGIQQDRLNKKIQAVPIEAVHNIEGESITFVKVGELEFEPRKIEVGWTSDKWLEIRSGIRANEQVVSKGSFILKSEFLRN
jgi:cobalt-zinc-cadmium efflux system membrane fusion protein